MTVFANRDNFIYSVPVKEKSESHLALDQFIHATGIPPEILTDSALELYHTEWGKTCKKHSIPQRVTEYHSQWAKPH